MQLQVTYLAPDGSQNVRYFFKGSGNSVQHTSFYIISYVFNDSQLADEWIVYGYLDQHSLR